MSTTADNRKSWPQNFKYTCISERVIDITRIKTANIGFSNFDLDEQEDYRQMIATTIDNRKWRPKPIDLKLHCMYAHAVLLVITVAVVGRLNLLNPLLVF